MRFHVVVRYAGFALALNAAFLFLSSMVSVLSGDGAWPALAYSGLICLLFGVFPILFVPPAEEISNSEGLVVVVSSWLACCLGGTLPYVLWGTEFTFTNAWFESVSGYTTTGSSILKDIEALPRGLLFWRSLTQWIGGVGILVFVLAALPFLGGAEATLYRAESSSLSRESFRYRTRRAIRVLVFVYAGLTFLETAWLLLCGLSLFDAFTHSFATIATGGFSPRNLSVAHFQSAGVEAVIVVFMVLSGCHFGLLFSLFQGNVRDAWRSSVVRYYLLALAAGSLATFWSVYPGVFAHAGDALRHSVFQVVSLGTSTGFATTDTTVWPPFAQLILILFTLQCACAGSTSGGIKADRIVIFAKSVARTLRKTLHPAQIVPIRLDGQRIGEETVAAAVLYILVYLGVVVISTLLLAALGVDLLTAFSGAATCMGNVGPGFGSVGSTGNFADVPALGKWVLSLDMLLGRLEIYGFLALVLPRFIAVR